MVGRCAAGCGVNPRCYNREAFIDPHAGWRPMPYRAFRVMATPNGDAVQKPVMRYRWPWFTDRCATWDGVGIGQPTPEYQTGTPYPIAHGWDCSGCRRKPEGAP